MSVASAPQTNGILPGPSSSSLSSQNVNTSQPNVNQSQSESSQPATQEQTQQPQSTQPSQNQASSSTVVPPAQSQPQTHQPQPQNHASSSTTRPRDARTIELLLTAQGVTAYEQRVPQLLLDFAYRHTASVLTDALHLSGDPYTNPGKPSGQARDVAQVLSGADAVVSANSIALAIASRLAHQFRGGAGGFTGGGGPGAGGVAAAAASTGAAGAVGGGGAGGGAASKEWMQELARERNKIALPRVAPSEWGLRLPSERFVLSGVSWGLKDALGVRHDESSDDDDQEEEDLFDAMGGDGPAPDVMEGVETEDVGGDPVEGGTLDDMFGDVDVDME